MTPPPDPLHREVEPPRPPIGPWVPITLLGTAMTLTIAMSLAVMARPPRAGAPATKATPDEAKAPAICEAPVVARPDPAPTVPPESPEMALLRVVRETFARRHDAIAACMRKWDEASPRPLVASIEMVLRVGRNGVIHDVSSIFLDDRRVPRCLFDQARSVRLPALPAGTALGFAVTYQDGETKLATMIISLPLPPMATAPR